MTPDRYFRVVGWDDFQHYKHRDPPWVKLHRKLLDNFAWSRLPDVNKGHLVGIWLLAGRHDNRIPFEPEWVAVRIGATTTVDLQVLIDHRFIEVCGALARRKRSASKTLARRKQNAPTETEAEKRQSREETEAETEGGAFELAWAVYPPRPNNSKAAAKRAWLARVAAGVVPEVMLEGVRRYAAFVQIEGTDPKFVKMASTFFGPDEHYLSEYTTEDPNRKITVYDEHGEFTPEFLAAYHKAAR